MPMYAARHGHTNVARLLCNPSANTHESLKNDQEMIKLLAKGATVDAQDESGSTPLLSVTSSIFGL